jgi:epoxyqueuosine reductase
LGQLTKKAPEETIGLLQELKETETDSEVLTEIANVLERLS